MVNVIRYYIGTSQVRKMNNNIDKQDEDVKLNLTSKDGTNVKFKVKKNEVIDVLLGLGFGSNSSDSKKSGKIKPIEINSSIFNQKQIMNNKLTESSKIERIKILIRSISKNPSHWFTSKDILGLYEQHIGEPISLSTVSTYLSRLEHQQILEKRGSKKDLEYCLRSSELELIPLYDLVEKKFVSVNKKISK